MRISTRWKHNDEMRDCDMAYYYTRVVQCLGRLLFTQLGRSLSLQVMSFVGYARSTLTISGATEDDRAALMQQKKWAEWTQTGMESCAIKTLLAGGGGAFSSFTVVLFNMVSHRFRNRGVLFTHVRKFCIRRSTFTLASRGWDEYSTKDRGNVSRYGSWDVA